MKTKRLVTLIPLFFLVNSSSSTIQWLILRTGISIEKIIYSRLHPNKQSFWETGVLRIKVYQEFLLLLLLFQGRKSHEGFLIVCIPNSMVQFLDLLRCLNGTHGPHGGQNGIMQCSIGLSKWIKNALEPSEPNNNISDSRKENQETPYCHAVAIKIFGRPSLAELRYRWNCLLHCSEMPKC